ncbi:MAG: hypothetical protein E6G83_12830, partial [Alphaproteobacteria bacterium]
MLKRSCVVPNCRPCPIPELLVGISLLRQFTGGHTSHFEQCSRVNGHSLRVSRSGRISRGLKARRVCWVWFALVVGWTDPEGTRPYLDALLLGYYDSGGRLIYAAPASNRRSCSGCGAGCSRSRFRRCRWRC